MRHAVPNARRIDIEGASVLAISAIGAIAADETLLARFLDLSGIAPSDLRAGIGSEAVQRATLDFLAGHEPDLLTVAGSLDVPPEDIVAARDVMTGHQPE
ncbi:MAG: DUF3572 family protein [Pacificimonas sp.]